MTQHCVSVWRPAIQPFPASWGGGDARGARRRVRYRLCRPSYALYLSDLENQAAFDYTTDPQSAALYPDEVVVDAQAEEERLSLEERWNRDRVELFPSESVSTSCTPIVKGRRTRRKAKVEADAKPAELSFPVSAPTARSVDGRSSREERLMAKLEQGLIQSDFKGDAALRGGMVPTVPLLTPAQERILGKIVQRAAPFMKLQTRLRGASDNDPPLSQIAKQTGVALSKLEAVLERGHRAKRLMVRYNMRLVYYCANFYRWRCPVAMYGDLVMEGMGPRGLERAVLKFDPSRGRRFSTYAVLWIRQVMESCLAREATPFGLPRSVVQSVAKINAAMKRLSMKQITNHADIKAVAQTAGLSEKHVTQFMKYTSVPKSLEAETWRSKDGEPVETLIEQLADRSESVMEKLRRLKIEESLEAALATLDVPECEIVRSRYGLHGDQPWTLAMIGERLGLSAERVRQIETRAITKLRTLWKRALLKAELV